MTETTITVTSKVAASPEQVYGDWVDASRLTTWWWPQPAGTTYDVDARVGGSYAITSPVIGATVRGGYTEVDPPRRLVFTWNWQDDGEPGVVVEDTVVVTFEPQEGATLVTVAHTSEEHAPDGGTEQGWNDVLARLVALYASTSSRS